MGEKNSKPDKLLRFTALDEYRENLQPEIAGASANPGNYKLVPFRSVSQSADNYQSATTGKQLIKCKVCFDEFDETDIASLPCHDSLSRGDCCIDCATTHFEGSIKSGAALTFTCPICSAPSDGCTIEMLQNYFEQLTAVTTPRLKLSSDVMALYHRKINIDWEAHRDGELIYCPNQSCSNVFLSGKQAVPWCPKCKVKICGKCKHLWDDRHKGVSCEQLQILKGGSDPNSPRGVIDKSNVPSCPKCKKVFFLERGSCDHMTCPDCKHQFCRGCLNPFIKSENCPRCQQLKTKLGLHSHHPRNCWFYLRDVKIEDLQQLLQSGSIKFEEDCTCFEGHCVRNVTAEDLYKEYLVHEIRKYGLDPASMTSVLTGRLESILLGEGLSIPSKGTLSEDQYRQKLRDAISQELPLPKI